MMRLFELIKQSGKSLDELVKVFPEKYSIPEVRLECQQDKMAPIVEEIKAKFEKRPESELMTIDGVRLTTQDGWGMIRASNTQPVLCVRFEGNSPEGLENLRHEFVEVLKPYFNDTVLKEMFGV